VGIDQLKRDMLSASTDEDIDDVFNNLYDALLNGVFYEKGFAMKPEAHDLMDWSACNLKDLHTEVLLTILRLTFSVRDELPEWEVLRDMVAKEFQKREPKEWNRLLHGLFDP